jgi:hypothetical protein
MAEYVRKPDYALGELNLKTFPVTYIIRSKTGMRSGRFMFHKAEYLEGYTL